MSTSFDFVVIGAGPGGEAAANKARELGATVAIADRRWFGGSCPHVGCIPSKSLLHGAYEHAKNPAAYEWPRASARRDYMVNRSADADEPDDTGHVTALEKAGATAYRGEGRITSPGVVTISHDDQVHELTAKHVVLAVGSVSKRVDMPGLAETKPWTNEEATLARELPRSLVVLGGGPTGCELAQVYQRFGVPTTIVQSGPRLAPTDHPRNSDVLRKALEADGVTVRTGVRAVKARAGDGTRRGPRDRARRRLHGRGPRDPHRGRSPVPDRRPRAWSTTASTRRAGRRRSRAMAGCGSRTGSTWSATPPVRSCTRTRRTTRAGWPSGWRSVRTWRPTTARCRARPTRTRRRRSWA